VKKIRISGCGLRTFKLRFRSWGIVLVLVLICWASATKGWHLSSSNYFVPSVSRPDIKNSRVLAVNFGIWLNQGGRSNKAPDDQLKDVPCQRTGPGRPSAMSHASGAPRLLALLSPANFLIPTSACCLRIGGVSRGGTRTVSVCSAFPRCKGRTLHLPQWLPEKPLLNTFSPG